MFNRSSVQCGGHQVDHFFQPFTVSFVETVRFITVYVQYSFYYLIIYDWNHDFRTGFATACDMSGKKITSGTIRGHAFSHAVPQTPRPFRIR